MKDAPDRRRAATWVAVALACVLAGADDALALDPTLEVNQYAHTAWRIRDGFFKGLIRSIAQTADGYLWLATEFGVLRFDGVRAVPWEPSGDQHLPSSDIWSVLAGRDGSLWIGTAKGLARWKDGRLTQYPELSGYFVQKLLEDRRGTVWAAGEATPTGIVCAVRDSEVICLGKDGTFGYGAWALHEDRKGNLWVGVTDGLWRLRPEPRKFLSIPGGALDSISGFEEDGEGLLLFTTRRGIRRVVGDVTAPYLVTTSRPNSLLRDRDGSLWIATDNGLLHVHQGRTDQFSPADGLSGRIMSPLFEDREGNIWVPTENGLDRFRDLAVSRVSVKQGMPGGVTAISAASDGGVWIGSLDGVAKWVNGQLLAYRSRSARPRESNARDLVVSGLPSGALQSLFHDDRQRTWLAFPTAFGYLQDARFVDLPGVPTQYVRTMAEDARANVWVANQQLGLFRISASGEVARTPWSALGHTDFATAILPDPVRGGLWLGFFNGGVTHLENGKVRASYGSANGLADGWVRGFQSEVGGALWVAAEGGLSRLHDGHVATLSHTNGLPCDTVNWVIADDAGSLWVNMACGLVRITRDDVVAWASGRTQSVTPTVLDAADGVRTGSHPVGYSPYVAKAADGRLWFVGLDGANVLDPRHLPFNALPPPVRVEEIVADRQAYDAMSKRDTPIRLPARTRDLQVDYTALSLVAPEKNRFKVKLEGWDRDWQDVGTRRQAFYSNLPPRQYRFRVIASNNSGVWNEAGASLAFAIAPAYYQTAWFRTLAVAMFLSLLWAAHQYRLRRIAHEFDLRLDERVNERTRVARELHDTLLQTFHGVLFRFQAAANMLPERPAEAKQTFESAIDRAAQAITEGRDAIQDLRASTVVTNDLAVAITTLGDELAASVANGNGTVVDVAVQGMPRDLHPILRDDIYRIAGEALRNAFRHAHAHRIEVEITYDDRQFRLQVRDDGKGIDPAVQADQGRGHFGLPGMRERAELVGGRLEVWSEVGAGTEVDLTIPAAKAYAAARGRRRAWWFGKKTGTDS